MKINNRYEIGQEVYLKTDQEQIPRLIVSIIVKPGILVYELAGGTTTSEHYDFEIIEEKNVIMGSEKMNNHE